MIEKANGFDSLGFYLLGVLYLSQMAGSVVSPLICDRLGLKWTFVIGFFFLSMMVFCQILPAYRVDLMKQMADPQNKTELTPFQTTLSSKPVVITILFAGQIISGLGQAMVFVA